MIRSYIKIGWRSLSKDKGYSLINIGGLALGIAVTMLIGLWVYDELMFDTSFPNYNRIARVRMHRTVNDITYTTSAVPRPLEQILRTTYASDFTYISMGSWSYENILTFGEKSISKTGNYLQADFPEMISLTMIEGTRNALKDPRSVLLSASTAKDLFGNEEPMNKTIRVGFGYQMDVKVAGIYEDLPFSSSFYDLNFIASWDLYAETAEWVRNSSNDWGRTFQMLVQLSPEADINVVSEKIRRLKYDNDPKDREFNPQLFLHPMKDWHLRYDYRDGISAGGKIQTVFLFSIIGAFVLVLATINFMNLSTARSEKRAKEVGIRMAVGSVRRQLIMQFLTESFLVVVLAFIIATVGAALVLPWFNQIAGKHIVIAWLNPWFWLTCISFIVFTSLLAGSYPALYLSSFHPVKVLKGTFKVGRFASVPRKILVILQFTVSLTLIIGTIVVYRQIQFTKSRPVGYSRDGLVIIQVKSPEFYPKFESLGNELKAVGAVEQMSVASGPVTGIWSVIKSLQWEGKDPDLQVEFDAAVVTFDFGKTVDWKIIEGRDFSREFATDSSAIILNEAALKFMGIKDPVGKEVTSGNERYHIIGIIEDMLMRSPYDPVRPIVYLIDPNRSNNWIHLKLNRSKTASECLALTEAVFKNNVPSAPFDYRFADQEYARKFEGEERVGRFSSVFATLAILISCMGLLGLASFVAEQRTKEIGIRKVLGASAIGLWKMLTGDFIFLAGIASVIASPLAYFFLSQWLYKYQYHTELSWWIFGTAISGLLALTLLTVSYQTVKATLRNPVKSLRSE